MRRCRRLLRAALLAAVLCSVPSLRAASPQAPIEAARFRHLTAYDSLVAFLGSLHGKAGIQVGPLTTTLQGRRVFVVEVTRAGVPGTPPERPRILLFGQQHGDEPTGKEALLLLLARCARGELENILARCDLLIIPQMNPDGGEAGRRRTADSVDLNRNHVLLTSPETRALHELYGRRLPHVTLDVHQYSAYSSSWTDGGFLKSADVQLGMLTNLNTGPGIRALQHDRAAPFIAGWMRNAGYRFHEYIVGSPAERIRHSTTEINDGRQSFGVLGSLSFIQEGIKWKTPEEELERCVRSQVAAIEALLTFTAENDAEIVRAVAEERRRLERLEGSEIVLRMDHRAGSGTLSIPVRGIAGMQDTVWQAAPYHGTVVPLAGAVLPEAYLIPAAEGEIVVLLRRHGVEMEAVRTERRLRGEEAVFRSVGTEVIEEDTIPLPVVRWERTDLSVRPGDVLVKTRQVRGLLAGILLEPASMWGLTKYPRYGLLREGGRYPIRRVWGLERD